MSTPEARVTLRFTEQTGRRTVAVLSFVRPPVNAIDAQTKRELISLAGELSRHPELGAVVIHGDKHFSAGDDIKEMVAADRTYAARGAEQISEAVSAVAAIPVPVVAAVTGLALGGGCELAMAADFRVTAEDASWGLPELHLGLIPAGGGTQRLARLVGVAKAKRLIYFGDSITGKQAVDWGLADEAVRSERVLDTAMTFATELAARAPIALRAAKRAIDTGMDTDLASGLRVEEALFAAVFSTDDAAAGLTSFMAHGPQKAEFSGR